jgi:deazaflavin-dependent oxidoreductase (nitroreductase family)
MSQHPLWYRNLEVHPEVEVELGAERRRMTARTADRDERARLWPRLVAMYANYDAYQARTTREIPVVILSPRTG